MVAGTFSGLLSDAGEDEELIATHNWSPIQNNPEIPPIRKPHLRAAIRLPGVSLCSSVNGLNITQPKSGAVR